MTPRESAILGYLAKGMANKAIATALKVSGGTVNADVKNLSRRMGAGNRTELVAIWIRDSERQAVRDEYWAAGISDELMAEVKAHTDDGSRITGFITVKV